MIEAAPRIDLQLVAALAVLDDPREPIAEINRRVGALARDLGLPRPSYAQVRRLLLAERLRREKRQGRYGDLADVFIFRRAHAYERRGR